MRLLFAFFLVLAATSPLAAADKDVFAYAIRPGSTFEGYVGRVMAPMRYFHRALPEGTTAVSALTIALYERAAERQWVRTVNAAMRSDADANDRLDRSELARGGVEAAKIDELFRLFGKREDGAISRHELNTVFEPFVVAAHAYLKIGDGNEVRLSEMLDRAIVVFREIDSDDDLVISASEYRAAYGDIDQATNEPSLTRDTVLRLLSHLTRGAFDMTLPPASLDCSMPRPSAEAEVVLVGVNDGAAISDVYVGSPEKQTTTAEIAIKAGREPLYIILSAVEPMIWRLTGATDRVERVVFGGPERMHSGATGVPVNKLALADGDERDVCVPLFHNIYPPEARTIGDRIVAATGRRPDRMAATYSAAKLLVTSMDFVDTPADKQTVPPGFEPDEWRGALQFAPAGLVSIDPAKVAAFQPAARYDVLPIKRHVVQFFSVEPPWGQSQSRPAGAANPKLYVPEDSEPRGKFGIRLGVQAP